MMVWGDASRCYYDHHVTPRAAPPRTSHILRSSSSSHSISHDGPWRARRPLLLLLLLLATPPARLYDFLMLASYRARGRAYSRPHLLVRICYHDDALVFPPQPHIFVVTTSHAATVVRGGSSYYFAQKKTHTSKNKKSIRRLPIIINLLKFVVLSSSLRCLVPAVRLFRIIVSST